MLPTTANRVGLLYILRSAAELARDSSIRGLEVHLAAGELRKNGSRIQLQEQQVLVTLLKRPGEIVTREELKEKLWAGDTFVDFDHSLSTAVNKIREVLTRWSAVASQASAGHGLDTESRKEIRRQARASLRL